MYLLVLYMAIKLRDLVKMPMPRSPDRDLVNDSSARIQYRYECTECPEETWHSSPKLQECPYCMHTLKEPTEIDMDEFPPVTGVPRVGGGGCGPL
jgi:hypothetical protein